MKITVVADSRARSECEQKMADTSHEVLYATSVEAIPTDTHLVIDLRNEDIIIKEIGLLKGWTGPLLVHAVGHTCEALGSNVVRLNAWPGFLLQETIEVSAPAAQREQASKLLNQLGWKHRWVPDVVGMVAPRIIASIINEAYYALGDGVSEKAEIDTAMRLGTNYPQGPFAWAEQIGIKNIFVLLSKLSASDKRYIPAPQLIYESAN